MSTRGWEHATPMDTRHRRKATTMPQVKTSKYHAKRTEVDGIVFHSAKEARRYGELKLLEKAGEICQLSCQPKFDLFVHEISVAAKLKRAAARMTGGPDPVPVVKVGRYVADFSYRLRENLQRIVEDVKGFKTPLYKWKKKHVEAQYGIQIREI